MIYLCFYVIITLFILCAIFVESESRRICQIVVEQRGSNTWGTKTVNCAKASTAEDKSKSFRRSWETSTRRQRGVEISPVPRPTVSETMPTQLWINNNPRADDATRVTLFLLVSYLPAVKEPTLRTIHKKSRVQKAIPSVYIRLLRLLDV